MQIKFSPCLLLSFLVLVCLIQVPLPKTSIGKSQEMDFEFQGQVVLSDGESFPGVGQLIILEALQLPFRKSFRVGPRGLFKVEKLPQSTYRMTILIPGIGEMKRTVEIGPSFADEKGRIKARFVSEATFPPQPEATISTTQLSVDSRAVKAYERALKKLEKGESAQAILELEKAVQIDARYSRAWNRLGTIAYMSRNYQRAENFFRKALKQDPESYASLVNLGGVLLSLNQPLQALNINRRAVQMWGKDPLAHSQLGNNYFLLGRYQEAVTHLNQVKELEPQHHSSPQLTLAEIYRSWRDYPAVVQELEEFLLYHPDSAGRDRLNYLLERARNRAGKSTRFSSNVELETSERKP